ncbi:hypothetical protein [Microvirga sesbaniae]|uniref:hypothetical protein n=1 Tax=Microvirga sesbaniae TaxID=681392 RepID=UPI0021C9733C|nr:hypothetical protein [Microvirga sp. HBU67692]
MARTVTIQIDDDQDAEAQKLREAAGVDEPAFWAAVVAHGLGAVAALQEADAAEVYQGPAQAIKPKPGGDIPF